MIGKTRNSEFASEVLQYQNKNITIRDQFVDSVRLRNFVAMSKYTLFIYEDESVLSSGALMDALGFHSKIIGPDRGAFRDMSKLNIIRSYKDFNDIVNLLSEQNEDSWNETLPNVIRFNQLNTWENFGYILVKFLNDEIKEKICCYHPLEE